MTVNESVSSSKGSYCTIKVVPELLDLVERGYALGPERYLLSALLFDGCQAFINYSLARSEAEKNRYKEAYIWVMDSADDYIFAFESVCLALGVNSDYLRLGLLNLLHSETKDLKKSRRNF